MVSIRCLACTLKYDRVFCNSYFSFFLSHNLCRPYLLSLDYCGETSYLVSYLCLHKRSLAWAEFLWCMGQNGHGQNSDGVIRVCTSSFTLRRAKIALFFIERLGFSDLRSVYFFSPGRSFSFLLVAISFGSVWFTWSLEFPCTFCFAVSSPLVLFSLG